jgi:hypothetical protein
LNPVLPPGFPLEAVTVTMMLTDALSKFLNDLTGASVGQLPLGMIDGY